MARRHALSPYTKAIAISKSDTVAIGSPPDAIITTAAGNLVVVDAAGNKVTFTGIPVGTLLPIKALRIDSTNTTATAAALYLS